MRDWDRVQELFLMTVELPDRERRPLLDSLCAHDPELRAEVESLLASDGGGGTIVAAAVQQEASLLFDSALLAGKRIGAYRIVREIGRGGMGAVYLATRDDEEYHKQVAIKVVKPGMDTEEVLNRFRYERQILANLDHPYIARLFDGGSTPEGLPFFVMEYIEGRPVHTFCHEDALNNRARCGLFLRILEAASYAHRNMVVHRDLKPGNIFVTADGTPKLLDFGIAKLLSGNPDGNTATTVLRPFTPEYASPEQVRGLSVTTSTDIYSLGAVLYELLTGRRAQPITTSTPEELERAICQMEPLRPSKIAPTVDADLDNIVLMAMRKEPERRYQSVDQFAEDIQRHLDGMPVLARQDSIVYRVRKFVLRNRLETGVAALVVALLLLAYRFRPEMPLPRVTRVEQLTKSGGALPSPLVTDGPRVYYRSLDEKAADLSNRQVLLNSSEDAPLGIPSRFLIRGLSPEETELLAITQGGEQSTVWTIPVVGGSPRRVGKLVVDDIAWSHDGNWFAYSQGNRLLVAKADGTLSRPLATVSVSAGSAGIDQIRWSPDDRLLRFTLNGAGPGGSLKYPTTRALWEVGADGRNLRQLRFPWPGKEMESCGYWTPDGRYFLFRSQREGVSNLWALEERSDWWRRPNRDPVQLTSGPVNYYQPVSSRSGRSIFAVGGQPSGELVRYDAARKEFVPFLGGRSADRLVFTRDGQWLAYVAFPEGTLWRARGDGSELLQLTFPPLQVGFPRWSADGKRIAFSAIQPGVSWKVFVVSSEGGSPQPVPSEPFTQATEDWMPGDSDSLIYSRAYQAENPGLYRFDLRSGRSEKIPGTEGLYDPIWSPDGRHLSVVDPATDLLSLIDLKTGKRTQIAGPLRWPAWSADSQYVYFTKDGSNWLFRVRIPDGSEEKVLEIPFRGVVGISLTSAWTFTLAPDDSPIILREHGRYDVYALSLSAP